MKMIGREHEKEILEKFWKCDGYDLGVIYGRRRIGKSYLLKNFSEGKRAVMFQATTNEKSNLSYLASEISSLFSQSSSIVYSSYENAFDDIARLAENEKLLFVIDEVSFLEESNRDILSIIQRYSDGVFSKTELKFVLCSSMESFMVERILGGRTPLFGRSSLRLKLGPIRAEDSRGFFPSWNLDDLSRAYVITGGVPYYLMRLARYKTLQEALEAEFFSPGGALMSEPYLLLYAEMRNVDLYMLVMSLIASGTNRTSKIADKAGISQALCSAMLRKLGNLSFVSEKKNAVINTKVLGWKIEDSFLSFWFRFVYPARNAVELDNAAPFFNETMNALDEFTGRNIEETLRRYIVTTSSRAVRDYGLYEFGNPLERKNEEIDFIAETSDGMYLFGEFKWRNGIVGSGVLDDLKRKTALVISGEKKREYYIVSKSGFSAELLDAAERESTLHLIAGRTIFAL